MKSAQEFKKQSGEPTSVDQQYERKRKKQSKK